MTKFIFNDGGRAQAGFKGNAGDCVTRAIAIATGKPYREVYDEINSAAKSERPKRGKRSSARNGVHKATIRRYLKSLGWEWTPTMKIGSGCTTHPGDFEKPGTYILNLSRHITVMKDGAIHDTHDPTRNNTRCVYGYWHKPQPETNQ